MVTGTGFEPVNVCVKGICVNRFTNPPFKKNKRHKIFQKIAVLVIFNLLLAPYLNKHYGAGDENRTHAVSLEG